MATKGWCGTRVGDAPHCAACRFELTGLPMDTPKCPECGVVLGAPAAVAIGRHERHWRRFGIGVGGLAIIGAIVIMGAQGAISTQRVIGVLSTPTLIEWGIERPRSPIARDAREVLEGRLAKGALTDAQQMEMWRAIERSLERPGNIHTDAVDWQVLALTRAPATSAGVRAAVTEFLLARIVDPAKPWSGMWSVALQEMVAAGEIGSDALQPAIKSACTPRLWRLDDTPVRPGETFVLNLDFPAGRIPASGAHLIEVALPDGFTIYRERGHRFVRGDEPNIASNCAPGLPVRGMAPSSFAMLIRAPDTPTIENAYVRIRYSPQATHLRAFAADPNSCPCTVDLVATLALNVEDGEPSGPNPKEAIASWVRRHLHPHRWTGGTQSGSRRHFTLSLQFAIDPGLQLKASLASSGMLLAEAPDGERTDLCTFESGRRGVRYNSVSGGGSGSGSGWGNTINVSIPAEHVHPGATSRLILAFDSITLPDGRTWSGPTPIEVEVDLSSFGPEPDW